MCSSTTQDCTETEQEYMGDLKYIFMFFLFLLQDSYYLQIIDEIISRNSNGRCTCLLTSITSKKVWIHMLYAPLTHSIVVLGSMGTGEDLFYKCCTHSEELSTHKQYPQEISPWNLANWLWVFLSWRITIHTIFTYWLILS